MLAGSRPLPATAAGPSAGTRRRPRRRLPRPYSACGAAGFVDFWSLDDQPLPLSVYRQSSLDHSIALPSSSSLTTTSIQFCRFEFLLHLIVPSALSTTSTSFLSYHSELVVWITAANVSHLINHVHFRFTTSLVWITPSRFHRQTWIVRF